MFTKILFVALVAVAHVQASPANPEVSNERESTFGGLLRGLFPKPSNEDAKQENGQAASQKDVLSYVLDILNPADDKGDGETKKTEDKVKREAGDEKGSSDKGSLDGLSNKGGNDTLPGTPLSNKAGNDTLPGTPQGSSDGLSNKAGNDTLPGTPQGSLDGLSNKGGNDTLPGTPQGSSDGPSNKAGNDTLPGTPPKKHAVLAKKLRDALKIMGKAAVDVLRLMGNRS